MANEHNYSFTNRAPQTQFSLLRPFHYGATNEKQHSNTYYKATTSKTVGLNTSESLAFTNVGVANRNSRNRFDYTPTQLQIKQRLNMAWA